MDDVSVVIEDVMGDEKLCDRNYVAEDYIDGVYYC